jgi:hypothetical protein
LDLAQPIYAVHDYFKHAGGRDIFLLDWRQVLSYDVSFLNIRHRYSHCCQFRH